MPARTARNECVSAPASRHPVACIRSYPVPDLMSAFRASPLQPFQTFRDRISRLSRGRSLPDLLTPPTAAALLLALAWLGAGCSAPRVTQAEITVDITVDETVHTLQLPAGSTMEDALDTLGITPEALDRTEPPTFTVLTDGAEGRLIRVEEEFVVEEAVVPFEQQVLRNESLPEGETRLIQPGVNGFQEITYRILYEDGVEVSNNPVKSAMVEQPIPEIVMVGIQAPFAPLPIPGKLAYLSAGNAWVMEGSTSNRRPVVTTGDLDGYIFSLSPDGSWLLFTRRSEEDSAINSLWAAELDGESPALVDLEVENVVHYAGWSPRGSQTVAYSTVEPREAAPGWQANNDLRMVTFSRNGWTSRERVALEANSGGIYGWWGSTFAWAPGGGQFALARPDGVDLLDVLEEEARPLLPIVPLQTNSDWAWVPGLAWGPDGNVIYAVNHGVDQGGVASEESPHFHLTAIPLAGGAPVDMVVEVGMFANPVVSPPVPTRPGETGFLVAFLQAIFPAQSETSRYRLVVMDRDGSNRRTLFPEEGAPGMEPQTPVWSPEPVIFGDSSTDAHPTVLILHQGNIWLVDAMDGANRQLTGDGLVSRADWR